MGLDMNLYKTKKTDTFTFYNNYYLDKCDMEELYYWRKHSDLHGLMEEIYLSKLDDIIFDVEEYEEENNVSITWKDDLYDDFNCIPLILEKEDVIDIIERHKNNEIPEARGFFWGESEKSDFDESLKEFEDVLKNTDWDNEMCIYNSWW